MGRFDKYIEIEKLLDEALSISNAADFSQEAHLGMIRKGDGQPYAVHPQAVYNILKSYGVTDRNVLVAAYLHDTIEDTTTSVNLIKQKFNNDVARIVKDVTSNEKELNKVGKEEYLLQKMIAMKDDSLSLKLADRIHNVSDITTLPFKSGNKTYLQTRYIIDGLREKRNLNQTHKKMIKAIENQLTKFQLMHRKEVTEEFMFTSYGNTLTGDNADIFKNPSTREIKLVSDSNRKHAIRFIMDMDKHDLYVFSGYLLHGDAIKELEKQNLIRHTNPEYHDPSYVRGSGMMKNGKIEIDDSSTGGSSFVMKKAIDKIMKSEDKFEKYFTNYKEFWGKYITNEEFMFTAHQATIGGKDCDIFENPTPKDILDIVKANRRGIVRFAIDLHNKKVFAFDGYAMHNDILKHLVDQGILHWLGKSDSNIVKGEAKVENGKMKIVDSSMNIYISGKELDKMLEILLKEKGSFTEYFSNFEKFWVNWGKYR
jgi:hypothetical protein